MTAVAQVSPARQAAFKILLALERVDARGQAHSDDLLRARPVNALSIPDRNLATTLVLGVLRWQIRLDQQIRLFLKRPNARLDSEIQIALRLGAFQLLHLDRIPAHAAIDESVELAKQAGHRFAAGMVNAVLRNLAHAGPAQGLDRVHEAQAHPAWMVERWERIYGGEAAGVICRAGQTQPQLSLRIADPRIETELADTGIQLAPGKLLSIARTLIAGDVTASAAFREGRVRIQDEGSQLVGEIAAAAFPANDLDQKVKSIVDVCAAPGGKTLILAERFPEARILACEASPQRLAALRRRLNVHADRIEFRLTDAATLDQDSAFDLALADVPCSGTGTLGRNPEIRHRLQVEDLARQAERQRSIAGATLRALRPGGRLVYSTCSLELEENEQVIAAVLTEDATARQVSVLGCIEEMRRAGVLANSAVEQLASCVTPEGALRLLPGVFGTDGFFVAVIERIA